MINYRTVRIRTSRRGFSLVEIVIVVGILAGISGLVGTFQSGVFRMNRIFGNSVDAVYGANRAGKDIVNKARSLSQSAAGAFPIQTAASSTFTFFVDADKDGVRERVRYFLAGTELRRGTIIPTGVPATNYVPANETVVTIARSVANGTSTPLFAYYDRNYAGTTTPLSSPVSLALVRHVRMTLVIDDNPAEPPAPITVRTAVTFRNLKDN